MFKSLAIASDHAGKELKLMVIDFIRLMEIPITDFGVGSGSNQSVDYPDYARFVAEAVSKGQFEGGILICGTGLGMSIAANKFAGVQATVVWDEYSCRMARFHNNSNVLCLGGRTLNLHRATELVKIWLETPFQGDRHKMRLDKIREIEKTNFKPR